MQSETNQVGYQEVNTQPKIQGQSMKRVMIKAPPKNSTKERFPITLQVLNSDERDPRRLSNHQDLPSKHQTHQPSKKG